MGTPALIALGSNLGDRRAILDGAVAALAATPGIALHRVSTYHETAPVGGPPGQGAFLNAAAAVETTLTPSALQHALRAIETGAGRVRRVRWGERTLDLDLLLFGEQVIDTPELVVPHPRMAVRRFVLAPLAEVAGAQRDPLTRKTIPQLLAHLDRRPSYVAIDGPAGPLRSILFERLVAGLGAVGVRQDASMPRAGGRNGLSRDLDDVAARARQLAEGCRAADDGWLVSDFCLDLERCRPPLRVEAPAAADVQAEAASSAALGDVAPEPTFAVVLGSRPGLDRRGGVAPFPLLWIAQEDPEPVVAEVRAACAASRG